MGFYIKMNLYLPFEVFLIHFVVTKLYFLYHYYKIRNNCSANTKGIIIILYIIIYCILFSA